MSWYIALLIIVASIAGMEIFAWFIHKYVMHSRWGWGWHESHHVETLVHQRWPFFVKVRGGYLKRLVQAHRLHHATHERDGAVSFGFLYAEDVRNLKAQLKVNQAAKAQMTGHAFSVEVYQTDNLIGGLYGVSLGGAFFGESMFSRQTNASKIALIALVRGLKEKGYSLLDTQYLTPQRTPLP